MSDQQYVKPKDGRTVRQPERGNEPLPAEGGFVPRNSYWFRRLRDEDVTPAEPPKKPARKAPAKPAASEE